MLAGDKALAAFLDRTGAEAICGYRNAVDRIRSAALDLLLVQALSERSELDRRPAAAKLMVGFLEANAELAHATGFDWYVKEGRGRTLLDH
jgi:hypothetical protein